MNQIFTFIVEDEDGLWGQMDVKAPDREEAERRVRKQLNEEEVEPNGSLSPDYTLTEKKEEAMNQPKYDSTADTLKHMRQVNAFMTLVAAALLERGMKHDQSKLEEPERALFDEYTPQLAALSYGSPEYKAMLDKIRPALTHHYARNTHHPEHFPNGIAGMNILDLIEMLCDWKAAGMRQHDGNLLMSIQKNQERFKFSDDLKQIFINSIPLFE